MKFHVIGILTGVALLTGACSDTQLIDNVAGMKPAEQGFKANLHKQYVSLSRVELDEGDHFDAGFFARRAESAAMGKDVEPDSLWDRSYTDANRVSVHRERGRLASALDGAGRGNFPVIAATAQTQFDCWVQELEENHQPDDIRNCRNGYEAAVKALEDAMQPKMVAKNPEPPKPAPAPAPAPQVARKFLVFFDFDSAKLTDGARAIINAAYNASQQVSVSMIEATGHADRAGSDGYNLTLSQRRAAAVRAELMQLGVTANDVSSDGKGEREPLLQTNDGVREAQNRRVEIMLK